jgi:hypothetical protein
MNMVGTEFGNELSPEGLVLLGLRLGPFLLVAELIISVTGLLQMPISEATLFVTTVTITWRSTIRPELHPQLQQ